MEQAVLRHSSNVVLVLFSEKFDGSIRVEVHQVVHDAQTGALISDSHVHHRVRAPHKALGLLQPPANGLPGLVQHLTSSLMTPDHPFTSSGFVLSLDAERAVHVSHDAGGALRVSSETTRKVAVGDDLVSLVAQVANLPEEVAETLVGAAITRLAERYGGVAQTRPYGDLAD